MCFLQQIPFFLCADARLSMWFHSFHPWPGYSTQNVTVILLLQPTDPQHFIGFPYCSARTMRLSAHNTAHLHGRWNGPGRWNMCTYDYPIRFFLLLSAWFAEFCQSVLFRMLHRLRPILIDSSAELLWLDRSCVWIYLEVWNFPAEVQTHILLLWNPADNWTSSWGLTLREEIRKNP